VLFSKQSELERKRQQARHLIELDVFLDELGTDAEFPQVRADRCLAAEGHGVTTPERVPAEAVCNSQCANHHGSQLGQRYRLRLVTQAPDSRARSWSVVTACNSPSRSDNSPAMYCRVIPPPASRGSPACYSARPNALISSSSCGDSSRGTSPRATFSLWTW